MKMPMSPNWIPGLILAMAWLPGGLAQNETNRVAIFAPDKTLLPAPAEISLPLVIAPPADTAPKDKRPPSKIRLSPWTSEIVKLAEARIEDDVMLSFIDNSGTFNLGADQIVYLSDLGVSSQVIAAMLQHDQDLVSGARPLTVASEPPWESELPASIAASGNVPTTPSAHASATVAPAATTPTDLVEAAKVAPLPEAERSVPEIQPPVLQYAMRDELRPGKASAPSSQQSVDKKKGFYPVREPYPVELTAPIVFLDAAERAPNTIIIVGFPRTEPVAP